MPVLEDESITGKIWVQLWGDQKLELVSNFNEAELINIYQRILFLWLIHLGEALNQSHQ
jgi:hypothetical protein